MTIRINGWQRIGIVLSILWSILVCGYTTYEFVKKVDATTYFIEVTHNEPTFDSQGRRILTIEEAYGEDAKRTIKVFNFLSAIVVPIVFGWGIVYLFIFTYHWIMFGFKPDEQHPGQIQIAMPLPVDIPLQQTHTNVSKPLPQKKVSAIMRAQNGEERLWKVFWFYNILGVLLFALIEEFFQAFLFATENGSRSYGGIIIFYGVVAILFFPYIVWALVSLWKCAFNTGWKGWGYLGRVYVVWWCVSTIVFVVSIIHKL